MKGVNDQYFIFKDTKTKRIHLEHIHAGKYDMIKDSINKEMIVYQTNDIKDPKLSELGEKKIIWDRHAIIISNQLQKVVVPFFPDNYDAMDNLAEYEMLKIDAAAFVERNV